MILRSHPLDLRGFRLAGSNLCPPLIDDVTYLGFAGCEEIPIVGTHKSKPKGHNISADRPALPNDSAAVARTGQSRFLHGLSLRCEIDPADGAIGVGFICLEGEFVLASGSSPVLE